MNITVTGRHMDVTEGMREHLHNKLQRLDRKASQSVNIKAVFEKLREEHSVYIEAHFGKQHLHANATSTDMYQSMDDAVDKLVRQIH